MRTTTALLLMIVLCGCGSEPTPRAANAAAAPNGYPTELAAAQARQEAQISAQMTASASQAAAAQAAMQAKVAAEVAASAATMNDAMAQGLAQRKAQEDARAKAVEESCAKTRNDRAADAQSSARAYAQYLARAAPHMKTIVANCKLTLTDTGAINAQHHSGGTRFYREQQQGVACRGGVPKGVLEPDVYNVLMTMQGAFDETSPLAEESRYSSDNATCVAGDRLAGLDTQVTSKDVDGIKRLLAWKPAP